MGLSEISENGEREVGTHTTSQAIVAHAPTQGWSWNRRRLRRLSDIGTRTISWTIVVHARTEIAWRYAFTPRSALMAPPLSALIALFWRTYMRRGIENVRRLAEAG